MRIGEQVEFQTGWGNYGFGTVIAFNADTESVTVRDSEDGSEWIGPADLVVSQEK